jgi:hypothetical protein
MYRDAKPLPYARLFYLFFGIQIANIVVVYLSIGLINNLIVSVIIFFLLPNFVTAAIFQVSDFNDSLEFKLVHFTVVKVPKSKVLRIKTVNIIQIGLLFNLQIPLTWFFVKFKLITLSDGNHLIVNYFSGYTLVDQVIGDAATRNK